MTKLKVLTLLLLLGSHLGSVAAPSALEVMEEQQRRQVSDSEFVRTRMILIDSRGREKERVVFTWSRGKPGERQSLMKFSDPADVRDVGILTWEQAGDTEDDQWLHLPSINRVKRVTGGSKKKLFMGTDLAFEDLQPEDLSVHDYRMLPEASYRERPCWVIEIRPDGEQQKAQTGYTRRVVWVDQELYVTWKTEYYGSGDKLIKTGVASGWQQVADSLWRPGKTRIDRNATDTATIMEVTEIQVNQEVDANLFTQPGLRRPMTLR